MTADKQEPPAADLEQAFMAAIERGGVGTIYQAGRAWALAERARAEKAEASAAHWQNAAEAMTRPTR